MNKTLFISDLDGTLLTPQATLAAGDASHLNALTRRGVRITYATARTLASAGKILADLDFTPASPPVSLMNGVLACDMASRHYVDSAAFSPECAREILQNMRASESCPFIYSLIDGERLATHYHKLAGPPMRRFMEERQTRYGKPFRQIGDIMEVEGRVIYFCVVAGEEDILRAYHSVDNVAGIKRTYYRDAYEPDTWYLEIFDESASKKHAVEFLRAYTGAEYVVCFGDNRNDMPMFEAADFSVAVANAVPELKEAADDIAEDGVVKYIEDFVEKHGF